MLPSEGQNPAEARPISLSPEIIAGQVDVLLASRRAPVGPAAHPRSFRRGGAGVNGRAEIDGVPKRDGGGNESEPANGNIGYFDRSVSRQPVDPVF